MCLYPGFAPFSSLTDKGGFLGWDLDYLAAFAATVGLRLQPVEVSAYSGIWDQPARGLCDIAASGISDTPDRRASSPAVVLSAPALGVGLRFASLSSRTSP